MKAALAVTAVVLMLCSAMGVAYAASVEVAATVEWDGFHYVDGAHDAEVEVVGACLPQDAQVVVASGACGVEPSETASGVVRHAWLGMDVTRAVRTGTSVGGLWLPGVDGPYLATEVTVHEPGDLTVTVSVTPAGDARPTLVPASAAPSADHASESAVSWTLADAAPGEYAFQVKYDAGRDDGELIPSVRVEHRAESEDLVAHLRGTAAAPAGATVQRLATVEMAQRTPPTGATPRLNAGEARWTHTLDALAVIGSGQPQISAYGDYRPGVDAANTATAVFDATQLLPGITSSGVTSSHYQMSDSYEFDAGLGSGAVDWRIGVNGAPGGQGLDDGDAQAVPVVFDFSAGTTYRDDDPSSSAGSLAIGWDGRTADAIGWLDSNEPASPDVETLLGPGTAPRLITALMATVDAVEGDVDNRDGTDSSSTALLIPPPRHWDYSVILMSQSGRGIDDLDVDAAFTEDGGISVSAAVTEGRYWLETRRHDLSWDWRHTIDLSLIGTRRMGSATASLPVPTVAQRALEIAPGERAIVTVMTRDGRRRDFNLDAGRWLITADLTRIAAVSLPAA